MTRGFAVGLVVWAAGLTGCTTCRYHACEPALHQSPCEQEEILPKHQTYAVLINGGDVFGFGKFSTLQHRLNEAGFAMVYYGELYHGGMIERQLRDVHCRNPDTRFVLVGYGEGAAVAENLAGRLTAGGMPVDAVVHLAPVRKTVAFATNCPADRFAYYPEGSAVIGSVPGADGSVLPGVGHYDLPTHPVVVAAVLDLMRASAGRVPVPEVTPAYLPILSDPAPIPNVLPIPRPVEQAEPQLSRKKPPAADLTGRVK